MLDLDKVMLFLNTPLLNYEYLGKKTERGYCTGIKRVGLGQYAILGSPNPKITWFVRLKWRWLIIVQPLEYWLNRLVANVR